MDLGSMQDTYDGTDFLGLMTVPWTFRKTSTHTGNWHIPGLLIIAFPTTQVSIPGTEGNLRTY